MSITAENDNKSEQIQELSIKTPSRLAKRVEAYAQESGNTLEGVVIEALDQLLRGRTNRRE
jgi:hypothetical protein